MTPSSIAVAPSSAGLTVGDLARALAAQGVGARVSGDAAVTITGLCQDSRKIRAGEVFAARAGQSLSGATFARSAKERGAVAIMVERGTRLSEAALAILEVDDIHLAIALGAEVAYGRPSRSLEVIGVTGTNGKTTVSWLLEAALSGAGCRSARLGTLGYAFEGDCVDSPLTTPEADEIARYAARARDSGATHLAMEVSSHALAQRRVDALRFACAAFTNLTQDHLDFHTTMEDYARAKLRLFTDLAPEVVVFNSEDALGQRIARETTRPAVSVSRHKNADVYPLEVQSGPTGMHARVQLPSGVVDLSSPLLGEHNLENLLITLAVIDALGLRVDRAARALAEAPSVPGRLERCDTDHDDVTVLVDYAHTPDALARVLSLARQLTRTELGCVFGCGGDRDPTKRPLMGEAVGRAADWAVVTSDNPRSEDPGAIVRAIQPGLDRCGGNYQVELDRSRAIQAAISMAAPGAVVVIAGKGHERVQIIGSERREFDDRLEARRALAQRRASSAKP